MFCKSILLVTLEERRIAVPSLFRVKIVQPFFQLFQIFFCLGQIDGRCTAGRKAAAGVSGEGLSWFPMTIFVFKLVQEEAYGTSLVAVVFAGIGSAITYASK